MYRGWETGGCWWIWAGQTLRVHSPGGGTLLPWANDTVLCSGKDFTCLLLRTAKIGSFGFKNLSYSLFSSFSSLKQHMKCLQYYVIIDRSKWSSTTINSMPILNREKISTSVRCTLYMLQYCALYVMWHTGIVPCFCQNAVVLCLRKNILFLTSLIWSLLCEFGTKIFTFPMPLLPKSVCFVTYWRNMWRWRHRSMYFTHFIHFSGVGNHEF